MIKKKIAGKTIIALAVLLVCMGTINIVAKADGDEVIEEGMEELSISYKEEAMAAEEEVLPLELLFVDSKIACYSSDYNGNKLTGVNKLVYDAAKDRAEKIAKGEASSSTISVNISSNPNAGRLWTLSEAGISSWMASDGSLSSEGAQFIYEKIGFDPGLVIDALKNDCPYEMYWAGLSYSTGGFSLSGDRSRCGMGTTLTLSISVSVDYAGASYFTVDTTKTSSIAIARDNVLKIVEENKDKSDYDKLKAYAIKISELADYNDAAVENIGTPYGDPWQLIYVFDNNPYTNVVCEGFSKAFQYLVENSTFESDEIYSIIVDGRTTDNHMWNIVHMDDGKNYVVDVTACEEWHRKRGQSSLAEAFLNYAVSGDVNTEYVIEREHSVDTPSYTYSVDTKKLYSEEELTISKTPYVIPCKTHTYVEVEESKYLKDTASCNSPAVYYKSCSVCGKKGTESFVSSVAPGHIYSKQVVDSKYLKNEATCTSKAIYYKSCTCGEKSLTETFTSGDTLPHTYNQEIHTDKYIAKEA
ncbi:MAG: hypothetical protein MJ126_10885, partial [Lachnospiraceae bacterium]|nr:hypothetical protein [Lachnospiraceae bacterium]